MLKMTGPPGPPQRRPWGDAEPEGPQGQTAMGHEGIGRRAPPTRSGAERSNPSSGRPSPPGGTQGGAPGVGKGPGPAGGRDEHLEGTVGRGGAGGCHCHARPRGRWAAGHGGRYIRHRPAYPSNPRRRRASQPEQQPADPSWRNAGVGAPGVDEAPGPCAGARTTRVRKLRGWDPLAKGPKGGRTRRAAQRAGNVKSRGSPDEAGEPEGPEEHSSY